LKFPPFIVVRRHLATNNTRQDVSFDGRHDEEQRRIVDVLEGCDVVNVIWKLKVAKKGQETELSPSWWVARGVRSSGSLMYASAMLVVWQWRSEGVFGLVFACFSIPSMLLCAPSCLLLRISHLFESLELLFLTSLTFPPLHRTGRNH